VTDNPFGGVFGDLFKILGQQGPGAWFETARSLAITVARSDDGDPNPEPVARQRVEQFTPMVARHVGAIFSVAAPEGVETTNRTGLTMAALDQWRPIVAPMAEAPLSPEVADADPDAALAQFASALGPLFTGFQLGSVGGHFSDRAWSLAALPLPRDTHQRLLVVNNIAEFTTEWSLDADATTVFALARELTASVVLTQPGTGDALRALLRDSVQDSLAAQGDLMERITRIVTPENIAALVNDPDVLLDGLDAPEPTAATRAVDAAVATLRAVFDAVAFSITEQVMGPVPLLHEAYRRHLRADARGEDAAAALFGISMHGEHQNAADAFVVAVTADGGLGAFTPLLRADGLPDEDELADPARWRARVASSPLA
jgi:uncharacterized protein (DUF2342 family)